MATIPTGADILKKLQAAVNESGIDPVSCLYSDVAQKTLGSRFRRKLREPNSERQSSRTSSMLNSLASIGVNSTHAPVLERSDSTLTRAMARSLNHSNKFDPIDKFAINFKKELGIPSRPLSISKPSITRPLRNYLNNLLSEPGVIKTHADAMAVQMLICIGLKSKEERNQYKEKLHSVLYGKNSDILNDAQQQLDIARKHINQFIEKFTEKLPDQTETFSFDKLQDLLKETARSVGENPESAIESMRKSRLIEFLSRLGEDGRSLEMDPNGYTSQDALIRDLKSCLSKKFIEITFPILADTAETLESYNSKNPAKVDKAAVSDKAARHRFITEASSPFKQVEMIRQLNFDDRTLSAFKAFNDDRVKTVVEQLEIARRFLFEDPLKAVAESALSTQKSELREKVQRIKSILDNDESIACHFVLGLEKINADIATQIATPNPLTQKSLDDLNKTLEAGINAIGYIQQLETPAASTSPAFTPASILREDFLIDFIATQRDYIDITKPDGLEARKNNVKNLLTLMVSTFKLNPFSTTLIHDAIFTDYAPAAAPAPGLTPSLSSSRDITLEQKQAQYAANIVATIAHPITVPLPSLSLGDRAKNYFRQPSAFDQIYRANSAPSQGFIDGYDKARQAAKYLIELTRADCVPKYPNGSPLKTHQYLESLIEQKGYIDTILPSVKEEKTLLAELQKLHDNLKSPIESAKESLEKIKTLIRDTVGVVNKLTDVIPPKSTAERNIPTKDRIKDAKLLAGSFANLESGLEAIRHLSSFINDVKSHAVPIDPDRFRPLLKGLEKEEKELTRSWEKIDILLERNGQLFDPAIIAPSDPISMHNYVDDLVNHVENKIGVLKELVNSKEEVKNKIGLCLDAVSEVRKLSSSDIYESLVHGFGFEESESVAEADVTAAGRLEPAVLTPSQASASQQPVTSARSRSTTAVAERVPVTPQQKARSAIERLMTIQKVFDLAKKVYGQLIGRVAEFDLNDHKTEIAIAELVKAKEKLGVANGALHTAEELRVSRRELIAVHRLSFTETDSSQRKGQGSDVTSKLERLRSRHSIKEHTKNLVDQVKIAENEVNAALAAVIEAKKAVAGTSAGLAPPPAAAASAGPAADAVTPERVARDAPNNLAENSNEEELVQTRVKVDATENAVGDAVKNADEIKERLGLAQGNSGPPTPEQPQPAPPLSTASGSHAGDAVSTSLQQQLPARPAQATAVPTNLNSFRLSLDTNTLPGIENSKSFHIDGGGNKCWLRASFACLFSQLPGNVIAKKVLAIDPNKEEIQALANEIKELADRFRNEPFNLGDDADTSVLIRVIKAFVDADDSMPEKPEGIQSQYNEYFENLDGDLTQNKRYINTKALGASRFQPFDTAPISKYFGVPIIQINSGWVRQPIQIAVSGAIDIKNLETLNSIMYMDYDGSIHFNVRRLESNEIGKTIANAIRKSFEEHFKNEFEGRVSLALLGATQATKGAKALTRSEAHDMTTATSKLARLIPIGKKILPQDKRTRLLNEILETHRSLTSGKDKSLPQAGDSISSVSNALAQIEVMLPYYQELANEDGDTSERSQEATTDPLLASSSSPAAGAAVPGTASSEAAAGAEESVDKSFAIGAQVDRLFFTVKIPPGLGKLNPTVTLIPEVRTGPEKKGESFEGKFIPGNGSLKESEVMVIPVPSEPQTPWIIIPDFVKKESGDTYLVSKDGGSVFEPFLIQELYEKLGESFADGINTYILDVTQKKVDEKDMLLTTFNAKDPKTKEPMTYESEAFSNIASYMLPQQPAASGTGLPGKSPKQYKVVDRGMFLSPFSTNQGSGSGTNPDSGHPLS